MRALLINPKDHTITEVDYTGEYKNIYTHIEADCFDAVRFGDKDGNTIFVDDEGLINNKVNTEGMFRVAGDYPAYLAGKGLILATSSDGESIGTTMLIKELQEKVSFGKPVRIGEDVVFVEIDGTGAGTGRFWVID